MTRSFFSATNAGTPSGIALTNGCAGGMSATIPFTSAGRSCAASPAKMLPSPCVIRIAGPILSNRMPPRERQRFRVIGLLAIGCPMAATICAIALGLAPGMLAATRSNVGASRSKIPCTHG